MPFGGYNIAALACLIACFKEILFFSNKSSWDCDLWVSLSEIKKSTGLPDDLYNLPSLQSSFNSWLKFARDILINEARVFVSIPFW